jgi:CheY-like chemotaxis protein
LETTRSSEKLILIIDDESEIREILSTFFIHFGFKTKGAANGAEGLQYLKEGGTSQQYPEVILLDLNMPLMNGWDFLV